MSDLLPLNDHEDAVQLANRILDRPSGDPDDDLAVLSRQFLRTREQLLAVGGKWGDALERESSVKSERDEFERKGKDLCQAHGLLLLHHKKLESQLSASQSDLTRAQEKLEAALMLNTGLQEMLDKAEQQIAALQGILVRVSEALQLAYKLPRPWMDGVGIDYAEWEEANVKIDAAIAEINSLTAPIAPEKPPTNR